MGNSQELEQHILGCIINQTSLLDAAESLTVEAFSSPLTKKVFAAVSSMWEDERIEPLNEFLLSERCGLPLSTVSKFTAGVPKTTPENFRLLVRELRGKGLSGRLFTLAHVEVERNLKTGTWEWDPKKASEINLSAE